MNKGIKLALKLLCIAGWAIVTESCNDNTNIAFQKYRLSVDTLFFGLIKQSDTAIRTVYIFNSSVSKIGILREETACGCTKTALKDSTVNSNDSIPIFVKYIPSLNKDSGDIIRYITVRTNSEPPFINLVVRAKVIK